MRKKMVYGTGDGDILIGIEIKKEDEVFKSIRAQFGLASEKMIDNGIWIYRETVNKITYLGNDNIRYRRPATGLDKEIDSKGMS